MVCLILSEAGPIKVLNQGTKFSILIILYIHQKYLPIVKCLNIEAMSAEFYLWIKKKVSVPLQ